MKKRFRILREQSRRAGTHPATIGVFTNCLRFIVVGFAVGYWNGPAAASFVGQGLLWKSWGQSFSCSKRGSF